MIYGCPAPPWHKTQRMNVVGPDVRSPRWLGPSPRACSAQSWNGQRCSQCFAFIRQHKYAEQLIHSPACSSPPLAKDALKLTKMRHEPRWMIQNLGSHVPKLTQKRKVAVRTTHLMAMKQNTMVRKSNKQLVSESREAKHSFLDRLAVLPWSGGTSRISSFSFWSFRKNGAAASGQQTLHEIANSWSTAASTAHPLTAITCTTRAPQACCSMPEAAGSAPPW